MVYHRTLIFAVLIFSTLAWADQYGTPYNAPDPSAPVPPTNNVPAPVPAPVPSAGYAVPQSNTPAPTASQLTGRMPDLDIHTLPGGKLSEAAIKQHVSAAVKEFLARETKSTDGLFVIGDDKLGKFWKLKPVRLHADVERLQKDQYLAQGDFKDDASGTPVELDYYVTRNDAGWDIEDVQIRKVAGQPRYRLNSRHQRVPVH